MSRAEPVKTTVFLHGDVAANGAAWCSLCRRFMVPAHFAAHSSLNQKTYRHCRQALDALARKARVIRGRKRINLFAGSA